MPQYKVHVIGVSPPHVDRSFGFEARNDREAVSTVRPAAGDVPLELWRDDHIIQRFDA